MTVSTKVRNRTLTYAVAILVIVVAFVVARRSAWQGSVSIHIYMELIATMLALFAGIIALVRFYSKKDNTFLFLGTGFLGTAVLDGYHTVMGSLYVSQHFPSAFQSLVGWSWISSRLFLSVMLFLSVLAWKQEETLGEAGQVAERTVYFIAGTLALLNFLLFSFVSLPRVYMLEHVIHRPAELLPALFFLLALVGYAVKGEWKRSGFEHWLVLALLLNVAAQTLFMPWSRHLFDISFNATHVLKIGSYSAVLIGLIGSMYTLFRQADEGKREVLLANAALRKEVSERKRVQEALREKTATVRLLRDVAEVANSATTIEEAVDYTLRRVCEYKGFPIGHAYLHQRDDGDAVGQLVSMRLWYHNEPENFEPFRATSEARRYGPGEGLPGRVFVQNEPAWFTDVTRAEDFTRSAEAIPIGLRAGYVFPVVDDGDVVAVVEFFAHEAIPPDTTLLDIMAHVSSQLGRVIERKRAEEALRASEEKFRAVAQTANDAIVTSDLEGRIAFWNEGAEILFGFTAEEISGQPLTTIIPERYVQAHERGIRRMRETGETRLIGRTVEMHGIGKERGEFPIEISLALWKAGGESYCTAIIRDITKRKQVEEELRKNQMQLTEAQRIAHIGSWEWDISANVVTWSDELYRIYGLDEERFHATYEEFLNRVHPDDRARVMRALKRAYTTGEPFSFEHRIIRPDGSIRTLQAHGKVIVANDGTPVRMVGTGQDITERKRAEEELERFAAQLEQSNRELENFAYIASHDLQEPLRKIMAFGDRLQKRYEDSLDEVGRGYLDRMSNAAERMQTLIEDLLTLSRVTTKTHPFRPVDLTDIVSKVVSDLEIGLEETGGRVEFDRLPTIEADPIQMRQLLQNLITNALKFRREDVPPVVHIYGDCISDTSVSSVTSAANGAMCRLIVEDNGIGFDEKYVERIFQPFQRLHGHGEYEGTGMGLAICRRIVDRHGGQISASSRNGQGATFTVLLPIHQEEEETVRG